MFEDPVKHILLATDLDETADYVARKARYFANALSAKLSMVHVLEPIAAYGYPESPHLSSPVVEHIKKLMKTLGKKVDINISDQWLVFGSVRQEIKQVALDVKADLIIVGHHSRKGLGRLLGSTASAVQHAAPCDVMTVRME